MTISWWSFPLSLLRGDTRSTKNINWRDISFCFCYKMTAYYFTTWKTIFSFSRGPEQIVFPKKLRWNMIFLVLSGKMIFLFTENMILPSYPQTENEKSSFSKKLHGNMIFFSNVLKRWSFQKGSRWDMIFLVLSGNVVLFPPKHGIFSLDGKWEKWPFSKNTWKHDIFYLICSTSLLPKKSNMILSCKNTSNGDWHSRSTP